MADHSHAESYMLACLENGLRLIGYVNFQTAGIGLEKKRARLDPTDFGIDDPVHKECGTYFRLSPRTWCKGAARRHNRPDRNRSYLKLHPVTTFRSVQFDARMVLRQKGSECAVKLGKKYLAVGSYVLWIGKSFPSLCFIVLRLHSRSAPAA